MKRYKVTDELVDFALSQDSTRTNKAQMERRLRSRAAAGTRQYYGFMLDVTNILLGMGITASPSANSFYSDEQPKNLVFTVAPENEEPLIARFDEIRAAIQKKCPKLTEFEVVVET